MVEGLGTDERGGKERQVIAYCVLMFRLNSSFLASLARISWPHPYVQAHPPPPIDLLSFPLQQSYPRPRQRATPFTRENPHDAKAGVEQAQRIRHQPPHTPHPAHRAKHAAATVRAPANRQRAEHIPAQRIHGRDHAHQTRQHEREEAVPEDAGAAGERECGVEVTATHVGGGAVTV